jgi:hypothetical protein
MNALGAAGLGQFQELIGFSQDFRGQLSNIFRGLDRTNFPTELQGIMERLPGGMDASRELMHNGGRTERTDEIWNQLRNISVFGDGFARQRSQEVIDRQGFNQSNAELRQGAGNVIANNGMTADLADAQRIAMGLISSGGQTPETREMVGRAMEVIRNGGRDQGTQALSRAGQNILDSGGMTQDMSGFLARIMPLIQQGGMTPEARQLFGEMMEIVQAGGAGGAVRPDTEALSLARDQVATATRQASESARRQALQRQGGAAVSGLSMDVMNQFEDSAMQAEAAALRETTAAQTAARLQQLGMASGVAGDVSKSAQALLGQLSQSGADVFRSAASNMNTGAGLMQAGETAAIQRLGLGQEGVSQGLLSELQRMGIGGDLLGTANQAALGRFNTAMNTALGTEQIASGNFQQAIQSLLSETGLRIGAGEGLSRLFGVETGRFATGLQGLQGLAGLGVNASLGQQGMDLSRVQGQLQAQLSSMGLDQGTINSLVGQWLNGSQGLTGLAGIFGGLANTSLGGFSSISNSLIQAAMQPGFWERLANTAVSGAVGGLTGGLGGALAGGGGQRGVPSPRGNLGGNL